MQQAGETTAVAIPKFNSRTLLALSIINIFISLVNVGLEVGYNFII